MLKVKSALPVLGLSLALIGCGSNAALLAERDRTEAEQLQAFCVRTSLATDETKRADGHVAAAAAHLKEGREEPSRRESDLAAILYRLALARRELVENQAAVETLRSALAKDKDQLLTYQQVLEEVKSKRKP